ncbi:MAG: ABC transporter permease [Defluviitaleaceae bacterium]|nr:ABC transporter permease [Defluviitaleaceae bacterium]
MRNFSVFFGKEWMETIRSRKLFILAAVFAFFAILSTVMARYMPEILGWAMATGGDGFVIEMPDPTWIDAWMQFYSNLTQIGMFCILFIFMNIISGEKNSGSAALTLTKNLSHTTFVMAKFFMALLVFVLALVASVLITYGYTHFFFGESGQIMHVLGGALSFTVFVGFMISIIIFSSTISKGTAGSAAYSIIGYFVLILVGIISRIERFWPYTLVSRALNFTMGEPISDFIITFLITLAATALLLILSIRILKKQEI